MNDSFGSRDSLQVGDREYEIFRLGSLGARGLDVERLPYSLRILLENLLRLEDGVAVTPDHVLALAGWDPCAVPSREIAFTPARVLLQDFTGVPAVVDLAAMRGAMARLGGDPARVNPREPVELVIDHSVQVDQFGSAHARAFNSDLEFRRNVERYAFLRWGQRAFHNFQVVPPDTGIVHQVNLEYLARVVFARGEEGTLPGVPGPRRVGGNGRAAGARSVGDGTAPVGRAAGGTRRPQAYPDTLVGTDSHTTMINGLGVLGWGVGGIEAEAAMLGQPISMLIPQVVGFRLSGELAEGATATDLVLTVTQMLRRLGVVGKFVEFYGPGLALLPIADRATIANMAPEYGATCGIFPVDEETLRYLRFTGRPPELVDLVEVYMKEQGLFHTASSPEARYSSTLELDLTSVEPSLAGPRRPQDRVRLSEAGASFKIALDSMLELRSEPALAIGSPARAAAGGAVGRWEGEGGNPDPVAVELEEPPGVLCRLADQEFELRHGSVVIAAITSCTNTSNPSVMVASGLLAKKAVERGLRSRPWVKTSLAPGSQVVSEYLSEAGLLPHLETLGFHVVGFGCTTCIGNSGPLPAEISEAIRAGGLVAVSVLSGNRNFEGRIHPEVRANYLASPPLVVAYALAGRMDIDLLAEPLGRDARGQPVYLRDLWPSQQEVQEVVEGSVRAEMFRSKYARVFEGDERWRSLPIPEAQIYAWDPESTYIQEPPFFTDMSREPGAIEDVAGARVLVFLGDSVTTDHISPAGSFRAESPAGKYLVEHGVQPVDFNSYGSRRGNHEVMMRGTFANVRLRNRLVPGTEGGYTRHLPGGELMTIFDAAMRYREEGVPLVVLAGKEYGAGSSRDWAAKGPRLLGVRVVLAESYERIHRSNLIGMGIAPLEYLEAENATTLGLTGEEELSVVGLAAATVACGARWSDGGAASGAVSACHVTVRVAPANREPFEFRALLRIDTPQEALYYRHGGILHYVLRSLLKRPATATAR